MDRGSEETLGPEVLMLKALCDMSLLLLDFLLVCLSVCLSACLYAYVSVSVGRSVGRSVSPSEANDQVALSQAVGYVWLWL
jgi:hypothetical protein